MGATKKILVTIKTVEIEVPEDWTDEQVTQWLVESEYHHDSIAPFESWKYGEDWRN